MQLKSLDLEHFKGQRSHTDFGKLNLLAGPNGSGKSARSLALQFAFQGTTPIGKKAETAAFYGGPLGCGVAVELEDGFKWSRGVQKDPQSGSISQYLRLCGQENLSIKAGIAKLEERVGSFAPMFDLGAFKGLSPEARRNFVLDLCAQASGETPDAEKLIQDIWQATLEEIIGEGTVNQAIRGAVHTPDNPLAQTLSALTSDLSIHQRDAIHAILPKIKAEIQGDMTVAIAAALGKAKEIENSTKAQHDQARQAAKRLSDQKETIKVVAGTIQDIKAAQAELRKQRDEVLAQINNQQGRAASRASLQAGLDRIEREIVSALARIDGLLATEAAYAEKMAQVVTLEQEAAQIEKTIAAWTAPNNELMVGLKDVLDVCLQDREEIRKAITEQQAAITKLDSDIHIAKDNILVLESNDWLKAFALWKVVCMTQFSPEVFPSAKALEELIVANSDSKKRDEWQGKLTALEEARPALISKGDGLAEEMAIAVSELEKAQRDFDEKNVESLNASAKIDEQRKLANAKLDEARKLKAECEHRQQCIGQENATIERLTTERVSKERELNDLDSAGGHIGTEQLDEQKDALDAQIVAHDQMIEAHQSLDALDQELTKTIAKAESEQVAHDVAKAVGNAIRSIREKLMEKLLNPLLGSIDKFLAAAVGHKSYCRLVNDRGTAVFEMGWNTGAREVSMDALSGGESVIFGAALAYSLVMMANTPVKLLLIEAAELDGPNAQRLINALEAISSDVDNVLLCVPDTWLTTQVGEAWTVIDFGPTLRQSA